jgi:hypothetical protein
LNSQQLKLESITTSESQSPLKLVPDVRGLTHIDFTKNRAGDIGEVYATAALMAKGATVFRNTGCDGKTDLCFKYEGKVHEIDVKLARWRSDGKGYCSWSTPSASLVVEPVYPLIVVPASGKDLAGWYCKWKGKLGSRSSRRNYHCPPGLENFWD